MHDDLTVAGDVPRRVAQLMLWLVQFAGPPIVTVVVATETYRNGWSNPMMVLLGLGWFAFVVPFAIKCYHDATKVVTYATVMITGALVIMAAFGPLPGAGTILAAAIVTSATVTRRRTSNLFVGLTAVSMSIVAYFFPWGHSTIDWIRIIVSTSVVMLVTAHVMHALMARLHNNSKQLVAALEETIRERELRERAMLSLAESDRLESVARFAGGVAHDINNSLSVIMANAELLQMVLELEDEDAVAFRDILDAGSSAKDVTRQLMSLGQERVEPGQRSSATAVVQNTLTAASLALPESISLSVEATAELATTLDDRTLERVLLNLVLNARDAIDGPGRIEVTATEDEHNVVISISDNGSGIDAANLHHIFEPYFTTKPAGSGTGLGLFVVFQQVKSAGGELEVESEVGEGTTFTITLPIRAPDAALFELSEVSSPSEVLQILVAEDEPSVRRSLLRMLAQLGHETTEAANGDEALALAGSPRRFDLLLTDAVMPGAPTSEVIEVFARHHPGSAVVVCSGWLQSDDLLTSIAHKRYAFIQKPFDRRTLARTISNAASATPAA